MPCVEAPRRSANTDASAQMLASSSLNPAASNVSRTSWCMRVAVRVGTFSLLVVVVSPLRRSRQPATWSSVPARSRGVAHRQRPAELFLDGGEIEIRAEPGFFRQHKMSVHQLQRISADGIAQFPF